MYSIVDELVSSGLHRTSRCRRVLQSNVWANGLGVALVGNSGRDDGKGMVVVERKGMVQSSAVESKLRDLARNECDVVGSRRDANDTGSDARCSVRDVDGKQRIVDPSGGGVTSDIPHAIIQLPTLALKKLAHHFQQGRKLEFSPGTLLEKRDSDKGNEFEIVADDKIQLLDSLHMQYGRLTNLEIAFILAIRAITGSSLACTYICGPIPGRPSYLLRRKITTLLID